MSGELLQATAPLEAPLLEPPRRRTAVPWWARALIERGARMAMRTASAGDRAGEGGICVAPSGCAEGRAGQGRARVERFPI